MTKFKYSNLYLLCKAIIRRKFTNLNVYLIRKERSIILNFYSMKLEKKNNVNSKQRKEKTRDEWISQRKEGRHTPQ